MKTRILDAYPVLRSHDLDHARAAVAGHYCDHKLELRQGKDLRVVHNRVCGANLSVNLLCYGGDVQIDPGELQSFYLFQIPLHGSAQIHHRFDEIESDKSMGTVLNPDRPAQMMWAGDCTKLMLQVDAAFLNQVAEEAYGIPLPGPVRFDPRIPLNRPAGRRIRSLIFGLAQSYETEVLSPTRSDLNLLHFEHQIVHEIVMSQQSNISHLLAQSEATATTPQLKRAIAFMNEHVDEKLTLAQIAKAAGSHPRNLQTSFRQETGLSPMAYLRNLRLDLSHYWLMQKAQRPSVSDVAYGTGYSHLGRFSSDYRNRFGHSPSQSALN